MKIKIFGAGSIGNHLAEASRRAGWEVAVVDVDQRALFRMKDEIYPKRYGAWDPAIDLYVAEDAPRGGYDVIFIGTPPHARMGVALEALKEKPRLIQFEKPIFPPFVSEKNGNYANDKVRMKNFLRKFKRSGIIGVVGYEYVLSPRISGIASFVRSGALGNINVLEVSFRENWSGILKAHPWLKGPQDSYLGSWKKGGGASGEHSHAVHFWQHFANCARLGPIAEVSAVMDMASSGKSVYDKACFMTVRTSSGFLGRIVQDVVTEPYQLSMRIQGDKGFIEWKKYADPKLGAVEEINVSGHKNVYKLERPDDFFYEISHIGQILEGNVPAKNSPISFGSGLASLAVVTAAHRSHINNGSFEKVSISAAA